MPTDIKTECGQTGCRRVAYAAERHRQERTEKCPENLTSTPGRGDGGGREDPGKLSFSRWCRRKYSNGFYFQKQSFETEKKGQMLE